MYSWKQDGISVKVVLDKRYLRNNGAYPIRIRVIYTRILKEFNTGIEATPLEWEKIKSSKAKAFLGIQQHIKERFEMIVQITERLSEKQEFSIAALKSLFYEVTCPSLKVDKGQ